MSEIDYAIDRLRYQIRLLGQSIDSSEQPMTSLVVELDWGEPELRKANDIFEAYDTILGSEGRLSSQEFENEFQKHLGIGYQLLKLVVLAFYNNHQWTTVCVEYARSAPCVEFDEILRDVSREIELPRLRMFLANHFPKLPFVRNQEQENLLFRHLTSLDYLNYQSVEDLARSLHETELFRKELAEVYPPKSAVDEVVRAMALEHPDYIADAFPSRDKKFDSYFRALAKRVAERQENRFLSITGPPELLEAVANEVNEFRRQTRLYYAGSVSAISSSAGGVGPGPHKTDMIVIHFRDEIARRDAVDVAEMILDRVAKELGMLDQRKSVKIDENL